MPFDTNELLSKLKKSLMVLTSGCHTAYLIEKCECVNDPITPPGRVSVAGTLIAVPLAEFCDHNIPLRRCFWFGLPEKYDERLVREGIIKSWPFSRYAAAEELFPAEKALIRKENKIDSMDAFEAEYVNRLRADYAVMVDRHYTWVAEETIEAEEVEAAAFAWLSSTSGETA